MVRLWKGHIVLQEVGDVSSWLVCMYLQQPIDFIWDAHQGYWGEVTEFHIKG